MQPNVTGCTVDKRHVDVAVIGAGTAGMVAYKRATKHTDSVLLIEGEQYGTTCARVGCMPSKLLIAAAEVAHQMGQANTFGIDPGEVRVDGAAVMERVRTERDKFVAPVVKSMESLPDEHRLMGHVRFIDSHRLMVGDQTEVHAERIVIATGGYPIVPRIHGAELGITSDGFFELDSISATSRLDLV